MSLTRRRFVASAALLGVPASAIRAQTPRTPTPAMTEAPVYPGAFTVYRSMTQAQRAPVTVKLEQAAANKRATFDVTLG